MAVKLIESLEEKSARQAAEQALRTDTFIDVPTLCLATRSAERVIRDAIANGDIKTVRIGRSIRIPTAPLRRAWGLD